MILPRNSFAHGSQLTVAAELQAVHLDGFFGYERFRDLGSLEIVS